MNLGFGVDEGPNGYIRNKVDGTHLELGELAVGEEAEPALHDVVLVHLHRTARDQLCHKQRWRQLLQIPVCSARDSDAWHVALDPSASALLRLCGIASGPQLIHENCCTKNVGNPNVSTACRHTFICTGLLPTDQKRAQMNYQ